MDRTPLDVSPVAKFLIGLVEQRASGSVQLQQRTLLLSGGDIQDITSGPGDPDIGEFALRSGRINAATLARAREQATVGDLPFEQALMAHSKVTASELRTLRRSLLLDRFVQPRLRGPYLAGNLPQPTLIPSTRRAPAANGGDTKFLPLILDGLGRIAHDSDAAAVGVRLNHRFTWLALPLTAEAKRWASLGDTPERPVVSALLARLPASAPQLAALLRARGLRAPPASARSHARPATCRPNRDAAPPAPRLSMMIRAGTQARRRARSRQHPWQSPRTRVAKHGPRVQLDPGSAGVPIEALPTIEVTAWPAAQPAQHTMLCARSSLGWRIRQATRPARTRPGLCRAGEAVAGADRFDRRSHARPA